MLGCGAGQTFVEGDDVGGGSKMQIPGDLMNPITMLAWISIGV